MQSIEDSDTTEMPAIILEGEMLAFINAKEESEAPQEETQTDAPGSGPESLQVIQVVNKLDDLPTDNF